MPPVKNVGKSWPNHSPPRQPPTRPRLDRIYGCSIRRSSRPTAIARAVQIARIRTSGSRSSRPINTGTEALSTKSRLTAKWRGIGVRSRLENDLTGDTSDGRGARRGECTSEPGNCRVTGQNNDGPPADLGRLAPPDFSRAGGVVTMGSCAPPRRQVTPRVGLVNRVRAVACIHLGRSALLE